MKKIFLIILISTGFSYFVKGESYSLSLEESIELAKEKSYSMQQLILDLEKAESDLKSTTSRLKTKIYLDLTAPNYTETVRTWEDSEGVSFFPVKTLTAFGGLTASRTLPTDGAISVTSGLSSVNDYYTDIRSANFYTRIQLNQPLNAFYAYNSIKAELKNAKLNYELKNKAFNREELNLIYNVSSAYYRLLSVQKSTEIALLDLERQTDAYEISSKKFEAGLLREVDALQMEVDLAQAQNSYDIAILDEISASNQFKEIVGLNLEDEVTLKSELSYIAVNVDPDVAVDLALRNRLEIREREIQIEQQELFLKQQKAEGMVKANLVAYFERSGINRQDIGYSLGSSLSNSFKDYGRRPSDYGVGLTIRIPILDWGENRSRVRSAKITLEKNIISKTETERSIEREVLNLVFTLNSNLKQLQLLEKSVEIAEKSFEITLQRFSDGDIDSQALALERERLNRTYTSHLSAYITYKLSLADLQRTTFYDFENNSPIE